MIKRLHWGLFLVILTIVIVLTKLLETYLFPFGKLYYGFFVILFVISTIFYLIKELRIKKNKWSILYALIMLILVILVGTISFRQSSYLRYKLFEHTYSNMINEINANVSEIEERFWENKYHSDHNSTHLLAKEIFYEKYNDGIVVNFEISISFFERYDFIYFSSEAVKERYMKGISFDEFEWLDNPNWAFVQVY